MTTLKENHVRHDNFRDVRFTFRGKGGKLFRARLSDRRVAAVLRRLEDLPGQHLFQFLDEDGAVRRITSDDVNDYIRDAMGGDFSAKDFRTWSATVLAAMALLGQEPATSERDARANLRRAVEKVAQRLCNTVTICRKSYVHPEILDGYLDGTLNKALGGKFDASPEATTSHLSREEEAVLSYLRWRLAGQASKSKAA